jgi:hypothetical protein
MILGSILLSAMPSRLLELLSAPPMVECWPDRLGVNVPSLKLPQWPKASPASLGISPSTFFYFLNIALTIYSSYKSVRPFVIVVGCGGVGKTCQLPRCCQLRGDCLLHAFTFFVFLAHYHAWIVYKRCHYLLRMYIKFSLISRYLALGGLLYRPRCCEAWPWSILLRSTDFGVMFYRRKV